jgi:hypothetical protein
MRSAVRGLAALVISLLLAVAAGCGQDDEPVSEARQRATPMATPAERFPAAYRLERSAARRLATADAARVLERSGEVVARTEWEAYTAVVLAEWLDARGVPLDVPKDLRPMVRKVGSEQDLPLLVVSGEHRRYADALAGLHPSAPELRTFYERFSGEAPDDAGRAMLDWLRVVRHSLDAVDEDHVVVIPVLD